MYLKSFITLVIGLIISYSSSADEINWTSEELAFINKNPVIYVAYQGNQYPYGFINDEGEFDGLSRDYLNLVAAQSGLYFSYSTTETNNTRSMLPSIRPVAIKSHLKQGEYSLSTPYIYVGISLFTRSNVPDLNNMEEFQGVMGGIKNGYAEKKISALSPDILFKSYKTNLDGINALANGEIDGYLSDNVLIHNVLLKTGIDNVKRNLSLDKIKNFPISIGVLPQHPILLKIINKSLAQVSLNQINEISQEWLNNNAWRPALNGTFGFSRPPFIYGQSSHVGFEYAIVDKLFYLMGYQIGHVEQVPTEATKTILLSRPDLNFSAGIPKGNDRLLFYSDPIATYRNVAITRKKDQINIDNISELSPYSLSTFAGASEVLGKEYNTLITQEMPKDKYHEFSIQEENIKHFFDEKSQVIIGDLDILMWNIKHKNSSLLHNISDYDIHPIFKERVHYRIAFKEKRIQRLFNAALTKYKATPAYSKLQELYKKTNFDRHIERANLISQIAAPYILKSDIKNLKAIMDPFKVGNDLMAISFYNKASQSPILNLQLINGEFISAPLITGDNLQKIHKESFFINKDNMTSVGHIVLYFHASKVSEINHAYLPEISTFNFLSTSELSSLKNTYNALDLSGQKINLTQKEKDWITNNPIINVGVDPNYLPFEAFNEQKKYIGIVADYLTEIEKLTNLTLSPAEVKSWDETEALIKSGDVEMVSAGVSNPLFKRDYLPATPFLKANLAIVMNRGTEFIRDLSQLKNKKVGLLASTANTPKIMKNNPNIEWHLVDKTNDGLQDVSSGKLDAIIDSTYVLNYLINTEHHKTLNIVGKLDYQVKSTFQITKKQPLLKSIIDKAINAIDNDTHQKIIDKWHAYGYQETLDYQLIWKILAGATLVIFIFIFWNRKLSTQIKARQLAELRAQKSEHQLFEMLNTAPIAVAIVQNNRAVFTNQTALDLFALNENTIKAFDVRKIYPDISIREQIQEELKDNISVVHRKVEFIRADGSKFASLTNYYKTEFNNKPAMLFWSYDVTELKELNDKLAHARANAELANQAKSDFLANMSHEIRTPMNAILGMSSLALQGNLPSKETSYIEKVHKAANSLLGIINDILDFSKIEAGKLTMENIEFSLDDVLESLADLVVFKAQEKHLECLFDVANDVPTQLLGDPLRLGQILLNLGGNAVKFTEKGHIIFKVEVTQRQASKIQLTFSVIDSGIGLTEQQKNKLFQSFSQADSSTTRKYGGTGLGLTICKRLVTLMNGDVKVESQPEQGSTFSFDAWFELPSKNSDKTTQSHQYALPTSLLKSNILIMDENNVTLDIYSHYLADTKISLIKENNSNTALSQLSKQDNNIALIIWNTDSQELTEDILHQLTSYNISIIFTTKYESSSAIKVDLRSAHQWLHKPFVPHELFSCIYNLFNIEHVYSDKRIKGKNNQLLSHKKIIAGAHVLLAEDNELNQDLATELLSTLQITFELAENGAEAVALAKDKDFDAILMDIQMPIMDGITATEHIRKVDPNIVIIAMTANAMAGDREHLIAKGMNDYISKPIDFNQMIATLARWVTPSSPMTSSENLTELNDNQESAVDLYSIDEVDFKHINIEQGLVHCNQNKALYQKILTKFYYGNVSFSESMQGALADENDKDSATRAAHTLKGSAGNIGAQHLQLLAADLEKLCHEKQCKEDQVSNINNINSSIIQCENELQKVRNELESFIRNQEQVNTIAKQRSTTEQKTSLEDLKPQLLSLKEAIENFDTEATDLIEELLAFNVDNSIEQPLQKIAQALDEYNFEQAELAINDLLAL